MNIGFVPSVVISRWRMNASIFVFGADPNWLGSASNAPNRSFIRMVGSVIIVVAGMGSRKYITD
jgi:hypothetical protein